MKFKEIEPGILIASNGRIFKEANYSLRGNKAKQYRCVTINKIRTDVHRLVAMAFIENPKNAPLVLHSDDNQKNNDVKNLRWGTYKENIADAIKNGRLFAPKIYTERRAKIMEHIMLGERYIDVANKFGVSLSRVSQIVKAYKKKKAPEDN